MCKHTKQVEEFHKSKQTKDGYSSYCSPCKVEANRRSDAKRLSENREKFLNQRKSWHLKRTYGITLERYQLMLDAQGGVCAICRKVCSRMLAVDHCHESNKIRGLLCQRCNQGIGMFDDDPHTINMAGAYLDRTAGTKDLT